mmetsp:Transcript_23708/g.20594  ORF Transcript_23708/g.20594 Transcript_23708/m.20594 type:complete len:142 (-) Transcript_23708:176-601(-)
MLNQANQMMQMGMQGNPGENQGNYENQQQKQTQSVQYIYVDEFNNLMSELKETDNDAKRGGIIRDACDKYGFDCGDVANIFSIFDMETTRLNCLSKLLDNLVEVNNIQKILDKFTGTNQNIAKMKLEDVKPCKHHKKGQQP